MSTRSLAMGVRCGHCGAPPGEACSSAVGHNGARRPLRFSSAHPSRITDAAKARGDSDDAAHALVAGDVFAAMRAYRKLHPPAPQMPVGKTDVRSDAPGPEKPPTEQPAPKAPPSESDAPPSQEPPDG